MNTNWSVQQQAIFNWFATGKNNLIVRARAGTGKTTTIIEGIKHAPERKILLAAFNKKIAVELTQRLQNPNAEAKTLHSVGFGCVMKNWSGVRVDEFRGMNIAHKVVGDDVSDEIVRLISRLATRCKSTCPFPKSVEDVIAEAQDADLEPDEEWSENGWTTRFVAEHAMKAMDLACQRDETIDFDDMIFVALRNKWVFGRWDLVVIDEAQDMNYSQLLLAQKICKKGGRIAVIGDDRQAIYGFRGADSGSIDRLKKSLSAQELGLTITYRCPVLVVNLAKKLVPDYDHAPDAQQGSITSINRTALITEAQPGDFVLSRKNAPLATVCLAFLRANKRAKIEGRDIGKTFIALVNKIKGKSIPDFLHRLGSWQKKETVRAQKLDENRRETKVSFINDQYDTLVSLTDGLSGIKELVARIETLFSDVAEQGGNSFIICSSTHRSKGLERDSVFLLQETFSNNNVEECNIQYVAITRSKNKLTWVTL